MNGDAKWRLFDVENPVSRSADWLIKVGRLTGLAAGIGTQALFAVTVVYLFSFLRDGAQRVHSQWLLVDLALALQFAVIHSALLHPAVRSRAGRWIRGEFYGLFFCVCTCAQLLVLFRCWRGCERLIWDIVGLAEHLIRGCFYGSWVMLVYSLSLTGLGYQTGWTQWESWRTGQHLPQRKFVARGLYRRFRHPVYLSFLGLIWFTPRMTWDHLMLTGVWTIYIFAGSILKDHRLAYYLGAAYRSYQEHVPGYPLIWFGPLGRVRPVPVGSDQVGPDRIAAETDSRRDRQSPAAAVLIPAERHERSIRKAA